MSLNRIIPDWTRITWWELHTFAAAFPNNPTEERRRSFEQLMFALAENFPCSVCSVHLKEYLEKHPIYPHTNNCDQLQKYIYDLHEAVNKRKGKPQIHTFEEVKKAFNIDKPWEPFGSYPVLPSKLLVKYGNNHTEAQKRITELIGQTNDSGMERIYLYIIIALAIVLFILAALAIYFFIQCKNVKKK